MQLIKKNLIKYKKSSEEGFESFPAIISGSAGTDSLPIGAEILIDNDAEVPNGWEVVDEKYDASEVYLANGQSVQEALENGVSGGVTSWNDLEDRPFYETVNELYNNQNFISVFEDGWRFNAYDINFLLEDGKQYKVVYGDNTYIYTAKVGTAGDVFVGNGSYGFRRNGEDNGEPVYLYNYPPDNPYQVRFYTKDYATSLAVYEYDFKPIETKYLPKHLQFGEEYTVLFDQKVEVVEGNAEYNLQPDNYLDTTLGTQYVVEFNGNRYELEMVYDRLPELFSLGVTYSEFHDYWGDVANAPLPFMISTESAGDEIYISAYEDGIYDLKIMCSPIIKHLDSKYIKDMYYETEPAEVTLIDEVYEGFEDWDDYYAWEGNTLFEFVIGQNYTVTWDGITYDNLVCFDEDDCPTLGSPWGDYSEYPFNIYTETDDDTIYLWIYTKETETSHTIKITTVQSEIIKIDKKYLPQLVGESTTGNIYTVWNDIEEREEEHIASEYAEIFNNYRDNVAIGYASHAEGDGTYATGEGSHAEGSWTMASGDSSHAEGGETIALGICSHAEGVGTKAAGKFSHAEGADTLAAGKASHAEGEGTKASGKNSHVEGYNTIASGESSHAEGASTKAIGESAHAEGGDRNEAGTSWLSTMTVTPSEYSGLTENIEVNGPVAYGIQSHAEGTQTLAFGYSSHAEGWWATAFGKNSHAEGWGTKASGENSHAEGEATGASGKNSHVEGYDSLASGTYSHAEAYQTTASGEGSHSEGWLTDAFGKASHAEGFFTIASGQYQHVQGKYNIEDTANKYAHIVGNGANENSRSNAHTLDWAGNAWYKGEVYVGGTSQDEGSSKLIKSTNVTSISLNSSEPTLDTNGAIAWIYE